MASIRLGLAFSTLLLSGRALRLRQVNPPALCGWRCALHDRRHVTSVCVAHDQVEAMTMPAWSSSARRFVARLRVAAGDIHLLGREAGVAL